MRPVLIVLVAAGILTGAPGAAPLTTYRAALYGVSADGNGRHLVVEPDPPVSGFARSPGGRSILFNKVFDNKSVLFAADPTGLKAVQLTPPEFSAPFELAAFSPDGQTIAFSKLTLCGFRCNQYALYLVSRDGNDLRLVDESGYAPSWSPDSRRLAFTSARGLQVLDLTSGESKVIATRAGRPIWAPRGERIAYPAVIGGYGVGCFVNADGSRRRCTHGHSLTWFVWSRDGKRIAFKQANPRRLGIVDSGGQHLRLLGYRGRWARPAAWSPDGRQLLYGDSGQLVTLSLGRRPRARHVITERNASVNDIRWRKNAITYVAVRYEEP
jgi:Tol biopolymer transport system component